MDDIVTPALVAELVRNGSYDTARPYIANGRTQYEAAAFALDVVRQLVLQYHWEYANAVTVVHRVMKGS